MPENGRPPVLWVLWNPKAKDYDCVLDDDGDQTENVDVWTTEQKALGMAEDYRREYSLLWVRLTPEIQNAE